MATGVTDNQIQRTQGREVVRPAHRRDRAVGPSNCDEGSTFELKGCVVLTYASK